MRKIAVMNQKGGVGKTTSSVNLAAGLALQGKRVCLIDLDPQAHASLHLGLEIAGDTATIYQAFAGEKTLAQVRRLTAPNLWLVPASIDLAAAEVELADTPGRELILRQTLDQMLASEPYDFVIMDCPPSLGVLTINALSAAEEVFIPLQPHFLALHGLSKLLETTALVTRRLNRKLRVSGIMLCLYETNTRLAADVTGDLLEQARNTVQKGLVGGQRSEPKGGQLVLVSAEPVKVRLKADPPSVVVRACIDATALTGIDAEGNRSPGVREELDYTLVKTTYLPDPGWAVTRVTGDPDAEDRTC